jgi:predicted  nucleic acid-binding Zn-ribbon protein
MFKLFHRLWADGFYSGLDHFEKLEKQCRALQKGMRRKNRKINRLRSEIEDLKDRNNQLETIINLGEDKQL